jgi:hypothetical protein
MNNYEFDLNQIKFNRIDKVLNDIFQLWIFIDKIIWIDNIRKK